MIIRSGFPRRCIFTNNAANASLEINYFKDRHNPCKKVPVSKEYLEFREKNMNSDLQELEIEIFTEYWAIETKLCVTNLKNIDTTNLENLQFKILDMIANKKTSGSQFDFNKELEKRLNKFLDKKNF